MKKSKKLTIAQKAKKAGIPAQTVYNRMHHGWHEKKALSVPVRKKSVRPNALERPKKVEPKVVIEPKKVEPRKAPSPLSQRMKKEIPIPVEKYEGKKSIMDSRTVIVSLAVISVVVILVVVNT